MPGQYGEGEKKAKYYRNVPGNDLEITTEKKLTDAFQKAHDTLWGGGKRNPAQAFDELDKLIFCKIWDERQQNRDGEPYDFQNFSEETPATLHKRILDIYEECRRKDPEVFVEDICVTPSEMVTLVGYLQPYNLNKTEFDAKGRAFEIFIRQFFRREFGQYFTPRNVVKFMVDVMPFSNEDTVLDPACGSGGFLLYALDKIRNLANQRYSESQLEGYRYWHDFAERRLFGIEISRMISRTAKMNMIIHGDGRTNVINFDALEDPQKMRDETHNTHFKEAGFDFILTNPQFGEKITRSEKRYFINYELGKKTPDWRNPDNVDKVLNSIKEKDIYRNNQASQVFFIEQCHRFLREGGMMGIVLPDWILTNIPEQYVRDYLDEYFRIAAVISIPQDSFTANGAGAKSSLLFLRKHSNKKTMEIQNTRIEIKEKIIADRYPEIKKIKKEISGLTKKIKTASSKQKEELEVRKADLKDRINEIRKEMEDSYREQMKEKLPDYDIFMAIVENIGIDATGRETGTNELIPLAEELTPFLKAVYKEKDFFA